MYMLPVKLVLAAQKEADTERTDLDSLFPGIDCGLMRFSFELVP
jgi:hypothetical protein